MAANSCLCYQMTATLDVTDNRLTSHKCVNGGLPQPSRECATNKTISVYLALQFNYRVVRTPSLIVLNSVSLWWTVGTEGGVD